jgi:GYF domain 2
MSAYTNAHSAARGAHPPADGRQWVVLLTPDTRRMMSTPEVQAEVSAGTLARETLVWRAGMSEWMAIGNIGELDVPLAQQHRAPPGMSWEAPAPAHPRHAGHAHARQHAHRPVSSSELMQELVTTGAVAAIVVAMTLYMLSLGGAFTPGTAHHAAHGEQASNASAPH